MTKLSTTQHLVLASACAHADGLATRPAQLKPAQAAKTLAALIGAGLVKELRAKAEMPVWRHDEQGRAMALRILKAGRKAVADAPHTEAASSTGATEAPQPGGSASATADGGVPKGPVAGASGTAAASPAPGSKRTLIIGLMRREGGATMDELVAATDWLPHTTRAALSGLRKSGIAVELAKAERGTASTYRVVTAERSTTAAAA